MRRLSLLSIILLVSALLVHVQESWNPSVSSAAEACSPNSDDWSVVGPRKRCVFNHDYSTRRRLDGACLGARPRLGTHIYQSPEACSRGGGIESIGQARAIKYLSDRRGRTPPGGGAGPL